LPIEKEFLDERLAAAGGVGACETLGSGGSAALQAITAAQAQSGASG